MAAVLACGPGAVLSHSSAAVLWEIRPEQAQSTEVAVLPSVARRHRRIVVHRRSLAGDEVTRHHEIPVTTPICTLIDLATQLEASQLEGAINEADKRGLVDPEAIRLSLDRLPRRPGIGVLREILDTRTFVLTDSELECRFLPLARKAGLPPPQTGELVNGFQVDFYWPDLRLVVETDGLRYHRTPAQQARDRIRDQTHIASGLTPLRFTHGQVTYEPETVGETLKAVAARLKEEAGDAEE
jgi:uncharacterized protein DUF559